MIPFKAVNNNLNSDFTFSLQNFSFFLFLTFHFYKFLSPLYSSPVLDLL